MNTRPARTLVLLLVSALTQPSTLGYAQQGYGQQGYAQQGAAQDSPQPNSQEGPKDGPKPIERLEAWPKLEADVAARVRVDVERLRKAQTPEMQEQAEAALTSVGPGAAIELISALGKERNLEARLRVENILDQVTGPAHTRLLAKEFANKSVFVRTWTMRRCAGFPDEAVRGPAEAALTRAQAAYAKKPDAEGAGDELYFASLCATSSGSHAGLELLMTSALDQWGKRGGEMRAALEAVRDEESTTKVLALLDPKDRKKTVAALNLLAGCGTRKAIASVSPLLDSTDNSIRVAAINAMRGIVDGAPALDKLSAFDAIEMAKQWKTRSF